MSSGDPSLWHRGGERLIASTRVLDLFSVSYANPTLGKQRDFVVARAPDWVNVVARTTDARLVLVRQFRFGTNTFSLEVPGGVVEKGEDPLVAGLRELSEETGYGGGAARLMGSVNPNPAIMDNRCHFVFVEGVVPTRPVHWDPDEEIQVSTAPEAEVLAWARSGRITHSLTVAALMFFEGVGGV